MEREAGRRPEKARREMASLKPRDEWLKRIHRSMSLMLDLVEEWSGTPMEEFLRIAWGVWEGLRAIYEQPPPEDLELPLPPSP